MSDTGTEEQHTSEGTQTEPTEEDEEIEQMKRRVEEMEAEVKKVSGGASSAATSADAAASEAAQADIDARSIYVGQVEYSTTPEELGKLFSSCGQVSRVTILSDKFTGQPKGFAYVEFASADSVVNAMMLNDTEFKGRVLKVSPKRTNVPGLAQRGRGRGGARGGRGRGGHYFDPYYGYAPPPPPYGYYPPPAMRGRGRGRGRGAGNATWTSH